MARQVINNGETGGVVRDKLNDNFEELYEAVTALPPVQVFVQPTNPGATGPAIWIQTGLAPGGTGFTFWFEDGL